MPLALKWKARSWPPANLVCTSCWSAGSRHQAGTEPPRHRGLPIEIVGATEVITMSDSPSQAFRPQERKLMHVAARLVRDGKSRSNGQRGQYRRAMTVASLRSRHASFRGPPRARRRISEHER